MSLMLAGYTEAGGSLLNLFRAANDGSEKEVRSILQRTKFYANERAFFSDWPKDEPVTALQLASKNGHSDCVRTLLNFEADISVLDQLYTKAVLYASRNVDKLDLSRLAVAGFYKAIGPQLYEELMAATLQRNYEKVDELLTSAVEWKTSCTCVKEDELSLRIMTGHPVSCLQSLMDAGVDVNGFNSRGFTPLIAAVLAGSVQWMDCLLQHGADVNKAENLAVAEDVECSWVKHELSSTEQLLYSPSLNSNGKSPLMFAVRAGKLELVQHLLKQEVELEKYDSQEITALGHATFAGQEEIVKELLCQGANKNFYKDKMEGSFLYYAVNFNNENIAKLLLDAGADLSLKSRYYGRTPFFRAVELERTNMMDLLLKSGKVDINERNENQHTPLMFAAASGMRDMVQFLLRCGADVNALSRSDKTALEMAVENGRLLCMKVLMEWKGEGELVHLDRLIHAAARGSSQRVLDFCLENCFRYVNEENSNGDTPLICAASEGLLGNVEMILEYGAFVDDSNKKEETAIFPCIKAGYFDCFESLIKERAYVNAVSKKSVTPVYLASGQSDCRFLDVILKHGGTEHIDRIANSGRTPLINAIKEGNTECVRLLLSHGADVNKPDKSGDRPLAHAAECKASGIFQLLLDAGPNLAWDPDKGTVFGIASDSPECFELLLKNGSVLGEDGKLQLIHRENVLEWVPYADTKILKLLFEYDVFEWEWYRMCHELKEDIDIDKLAFAAVSTGHSLYSFKTEEGQTSSLLQEAFLRSESRYGRNYSAARYMLANLYLTVEDYRKLSANHEGFHQRVRATEKVHPETVALLECVSSEPWRLETVCFVVVSSSIQASRQPGQTRAAQVDQLPLPEMLKLKLKFKDPMQDICFHEWEEILSSEPDKLLNLYKPQCYRRRDELVPCPKDCYYCHGAALSEPGGEDENSDFYF